MRIIARRSLLEFSTKHADAKGALNEWWHVVKRADWKSPQDIKNVMPKASIIAENRVVFNICGGSYRLIVKFNYQYGGGWVRFIGTHAEYDKVDATKI